MEERLYKPGEFAKLLNVSVRTLHRWDKAGILVAHRSPTDRRYYTHWQYLDFRASRELKGEGTMTGQFFKLAIDGDVLRVGFGDPASNDVIVKDATASLKQMKADGVLTGGPLLKVNGPASLPVAVVLAHTLVHLYGAVAVFDPKLQKYVVSVSHNPDYAVGDLID